MVTALRSRSLRGELRTPVSATTAEPPDPDRLVSPQPAAATISRRGALGMVAAGSLALLGLSVGQTIGGSARSTALLSPRGQNESEGPADFQVNKTAAGSGRRRLAAGTHRPSDQDHPVAVPGATARAATAHGPVADRLRGGLVHRRANLDRGTAGCSRRRG
jgi:hypothetical protein